MKIENLLKYSRDPLYKNSFFLMTTRVFNVACGFIFWIIAAKYYSVENVGVATALISSLSLVILFSRFGFDFALIRFININEKGKVINTCLNITTLLSIATGIIYMMGANIFSPSLSFIQKPEYAAPFMVFVIMNSVVSITGNAFTALRNASYFFYQNVFLASRIPLLIPLALMGSFGIFGALGLGYLFSAVFGFFLLKKFMNFDFKLDMPFIKESFGFSSGNYISSIFQAVPTLILPILILNISGEAEAARYYIAFAIGNLVLIIPDALSTSLFVEGSHGESLRKIVTRAGAAIFSFLVPAVLVIVLFGKFLLGLVGKDYVGAYELLRLLALSSFFVAVYSLFIPIQNVRLKVESIVKLNFLRSVLLMGLSYIFILKFGIVGAGYAWMVTYGILSVGIIWMVRRMGWI
ncbi:Polysaccharide biosynthesis protein [uncultured archaeon]|nr:Polysaccharide biosynthesis protein [uncultured archaeon]